MTTVVSKLTVAVALLTGATASFAASHPRAALPARAALTSTGASSMSVRYDDLNLSTTAGVDTLYRRISFAARQVCPNIYSRELAAVQAAERCQAAAVSRAVTEINNQHLAMLHAAHGSHS